MSRPDAWTQEERALLAETYPAGGVNAATDVLPDRSWHAIHVMAHKLGLKAPIVTDAPKPVLDGERLEQAIRRHEEGASFMAIGREFGVCATAATNAILIALCPRRGFRPAERDATGRLTDESKERLRYMLKKGLKGVDIQLRLGISAARVAEERRRYNADLARRGKASLPPPGAGEQYSGVQIPAAKRREVEAILLEGHGSTTAARRTGISVPSAKRIRIRVIARLARRGQTLPGCDRAGRRNAAAKASPHYIPEGAIADLRERLLAGEPVQPAARACGIGQCGAYRIRDRLAAELAAKGETLPKPQRKGRGAAYREARREADWLPAGRMNELRALAHEHGHEEAKRIMRDRLAEEAAERAAAEAVERARPKTFEEKLARLARGEASVVPTLHLRRPGPSMTLGGVASGTF